MKTEAPIYLDHQASTPVDSTVLREMLPFFAESFANPHSSDHSAGWAADAAIQASRSKISKLVGCDPDEIIFTSGATEANNLAILGLRKIALTTGRKSIITSKIEHKSTLSACRYMSDDFGFKTLFCNVDSYGKLDCDHLRNIISDEVLLLTIGGVNSEVGTIQNIEDIFELVARFGVLIHVDGAQMPLACDVSAIARYADLVSLSGHKIYGPKGIGCLYVRRSLQNDLAPIILGGGQQNGLRSGTLPVPLCVGMGVAADLVGPTAERDRLRANTERLWGKLRAVDHTLMLNGPPLAERHPGNLNVRFPGIDAEDLLAALQPHLAASTGSACTSGTREASHVLRGIGLSESEARSSIRFSLGRTTTDEQIERTVELIGAVLRKLEATGMRELS